MRRGSTLGCSSTKLVVFPVLTLLSVVLFCIKFFNISVEISGVNNASRGINIPETDLSVGDAHKSVVSTQPTAAETIRGEEAITNVSIPFAKKESSPYAYVTLIAGIDKSYKYRGFLYNTLIMKRSLVQEGSTADFVALVGYSEEDTSPFESDIAMLSAHGIIVHVLTRLLSAAHPFGFAEMALLKITPW